MVTCKEYVEMRKTELKEEIATFLYKPKLCVIQVGNDAASEVYVRNKKKTCEELGIEFEHEHITEYENMTDFDLVKIIMKKNSDRSISGLILQLPIPKQFDEKFVTDYIYNAKDVDGFSPITKFTPCTPKGIMDYLKYNGVDFAGKECVVIGRSDIVGKPLVKLLINEGATVTCCNSRTPDIRKHTLDADIIVSAIGKANYFDDSYFSKGQILVDVGINRDEDGKLCGDISRWAKETDKKLATPVPGGVGLLTVCALMENIVEAHKLIHMYDRR